VGAITASKTFAFEYRNWNRETILRSSDDIRPRLLANLALAAPNPCKPPRPDERAEVKPEAFALIENGPDFWRLLILSDGMCDGGATAYCIPK
jgi:hypothetical protein